MVLRGHNMFLYVSMFSNSNSSKSNLTRCALRDGFFLTSLFVLVVKIKVPPPRSLPFSNLGPGAALGGGSRRRAMGYATLSAGLA